MPKPDSFEGAYSVLEHFLHRIALGPRSVRAASFDVEQSFVKPDPGLIGDGRHVFIAGLARAGTTVLLQALHGTGHFRSLTYREMPFVLMPNLWRRLSPGGHKIELLRERAHGDGLLVNYDSPEAFEEVFWKTFTQVDYLLVDRLIPHTVGNDVIRKFRSYIAAILASPGEQDLLYLSKNNNNILRLAAIRQAFPMAVILVPFRHPVPHALSLLEQHSRFGALHTPRSFLHDYMTWLGHHEFGSTHRPFAFQPGDIERMQRYDPNSAEYWLAAWIGAYRHLIDNSAGALFISHETICEAPGPILRALSGLTGHDLATTDAIATFRPSRPASRAIADSPLLEEALELHAQLLART